MNFLTRIGLRKVTEWTGVRAVGKLVLGVQKRAREGEISSGFGKGLRLRVLPETPRTYLLGTHEPDLQRSIQEWVKPGQVVYDCGANIGYFTAMFARLVGETGQVMAFEPSPESFASLKQVGKLNGFASITAAEVAIWSHSGTLILQGDLPEKSLVSDRVGTEGKGPSVHCVSLDDWVFQQGNPPPDLIKMDVEGAEGEALKGARRVLREHRPLLLLEIHGEPGRLAWEVLQEVGYSSRNLATGETPASVDEFAVWIRQYLVTPSPLAKSAAGR